MCFALCIMRLIPRTEPNIMRFASCHWCLAYCNIALNYRALNYRALSWTSLPFAHCLLIATLAHCYMAILLHCLLPHLFYEKCLPKNCLFFKIKETLKEKLALIGLRENCNLLRLQATLDVMICSFHKFH